MRLLTFEQNGTLHPGISTSEGVIDASSLYPDMASLISDADNALAKLTDLAASAENYLNETSLTLGPCVPVPGKIFCVGLNYRKHAEETGATLPNYPIMFSKFQNAIAAYGDVVPLLPGINVDYEAELVVVVGKPAWQVSEDEALDHVFGYCCGNDVSARVLQKRTSQWLMGKSLDKFLPIGPYLVTADEVGDPHILRITTQVNGEKRQDSNTGDMIFNVKQLIADVSSYIRLEPGDIISTGTPSGVAAGMPQPAWLKPGDEVVVEIEKLGSLLNTFAAAQV